VASKALVNTIVTADNLNRIVNELWRNSARTFYPMTNGSTNVSTAPILPSVHRYLSSGRGARRGGPDRLQER
jgi:hypothetical protein